jgi:hypothetical protein
LKGNVTPTIEFAFADGVRIIKEPTISSSTDLSKFRSYKNMVDKEILILYNPSNPAEFSIAGDRTSNILIFVFFRDWRSTIYYDKHSKCFRLFKIWSSVKHSIEIISPSWGHLKKFALYY